MKISYAITVCNEYNEIKRLVDNLLKYKRVIDEIVILFDKNNGTIEIENFLNPLSLKSNVLIYKSNEFNNNFSDWKNKINDLCNGDFIFQLDGDEFIDEKLIKNLPLIIEMNPNIDLIYVPRINIVNDITENHIINWKWNITKLENFIKEKTINIDSDEYKFFKKFNLLIDEKKVNNNIKIKYNTPIINFPDYQSRIYRKGLLWSGSVHETIINFKNYSFFPQNDLYCIKHIKDIKKQEKQNMFYINIQNNE